MELIIKHTLCDDYVRGFSVCVSSFLLVVVNVQI